MPAVVALSSADSRSARRLARLLVSRKIAACVTVLPGAASVFRWKGRVESARESLLWIKTSRAGAALLEKFFEENHPYQTPELLMLPVAGGAKKYLGWLKENAR